MNVIKFTKDEFADYISKHKIARKDIIEKYITENPKTEYTYTDIDTVYQMQVEIQIGAHTVGRAKVGRVNCGYGATRTINGVKYGHE